MNNYSLIHPDTLRSMTELAGRTPFGCFVEVGVYKGGSALELNRVCKAQGRELYLYDTFTGIPHKAEIDSHKVGDFGDTSYEAVRKLIPEAIIVQGIFPGSAIKMPPISFVHLDVDQYQSYRECIDYLSPRIISGGIMWFDDWGCLEGADKAIYESFPNERLEKYAGKMIVRF